MRFFPVSTIFAAMLCAQVPAPAPATRTEPSLDTVIASSDGQTVTYGQLRAFVSVLVQPQQQASALRDPGTLVHRYFLWLRLAAIAESEKLDQQSPAKEQLFWD